MDLENIGLDCDDYKLNKIISIFVVGHLKMARIIIFAIEILAETY